MTSGARPAALVRVSGQVPAVRAEETRARLITVAPSGFEERDAGDDVVFSVYVQPGRASAAMAALPRATVEPVAPGWEEAWRSFHRPVVAGGIWLGPPWETAPAGLPAVVVDPGRAFGTGAHATTRLCVELLARVERGSLLDVGCGSGVLSIAAARLGFGPLAAVDDDPVAVEVTRANAAANGVEVDVRLADATVDALPAADTAVVNILLPAVAAVLPRLVARHAVTSGYLAGEEPACAGWDRVERVDADGWGADLLRRE